MQADSNSKMLEVCFNTNLSKLSLPELANMLVALTRQNSMLGQSSSSSRTDAAAVQIRWLDDVAIALKGRIISAQPAPDASTMEALAPCLAALHSLGCKKASDLAVSCTQFALRVEACDARSHMLAVSQAVKEGAAAK